jgi:hypothetical protein
MSANLMIPTFEGVPIDEARLNKVNNTFVMPELGLELKYPPFEDSDPFLDHPNHHIKTQKGEYYPRTKTYSSGANFESNLTDGHKDCRNKDLAENASLSAVRIDSKITEELALKKATSNKLNEYPHNFLTPRYAKYDLWQKDREINLVLESTFQSTNINRGRSEKSFNAEITIGNY